MTYKIGDNCVYLGRVHGKISAIGKGQLKYQITWDGGKVDHWSQKDFNKGLIKCSPSSTCAVGWAPASPMLDSNQGRLNLLDSANATNFVSASSSSDTQTSKSPPTFSTSTTRQTTQTSLQLAPPVSPSVLRENDAVQMMTEIVSPQSSPQLPQYNQSILQLKMSPEFYLAHTDQVWEKEPISGISCGSYPNAGTMQNGKLSAADTLAAPGADFGYSWLASPGGLSSGKSRSPGQSKCESVLKKIHVLQNGECLNPNWIEAHFSLPDTWSDPSERKSATQLLEIEEQHSATALTPELPESQSTECFTSIVLPNLTGQSFYYEEYDVAVTVVDMKFVEINGEKFDNSLGILCEPWWTHSLRKTFRVKREDLESIKLSCDWSPPIKQSGSIYQYTSQKKGICYPKVTGERKREEDKHWYWGFSYVEKSLGKWRDKSAAIPQKKLKAVRQALRDKKSYQYILQKILSKD